MHIFHDGGGQRLMDSFYQDSRVVAEFYGPGINDHVEKGSSNPYCGKLLNKMQAHTLNKRTLTDSRFSAGY